MENKNEKIYNHNYQSKKDNARNEIAYHNLIFNPNGFYSIPPMTNILFVENHYLNKKRENPITAQNNISKFGQNDKCKYFLNLFFEINSFSFKK